MFIADEVQAGFGRTGKDLSYQHETGVQPDLVTMGKAVTGGKIHALFAFHGIPQTY